MCLEELLYSPLLSAMTGLCEGRTNPLRTAWLRDGICVELGVWDERAEVFSHFGFPVSALDPPDRTLQSGDLCLEA